MCDFDYCGPCYDSRIKVVNFLTTNQIMVSEIKKPLSPNCPKDHQLILSTRVTRWLCDARKEVGGCKCGDGSSSSVDG